MLKRFSQCPLIPNIFFCLQSLPLLQNPFFNLNIFTEFPFNWVLLWYLETHLLFPALFDLIRIGQKATPGKIGKHFSPWSANWSSSGTYKHFMLEYNNTDTLSEIPQTLKSLLMACFSQSSLHSSLPWAQCARSCLIEKC